MVALVQQASVPVSRLPNAWIILEEFDKAGYDVNLAIAAVINAIKESGLNEKADTGDGGHSWGLFQINDVQGKRFNPNVSDTIAYTNRKDPRQATQWIIAEMKRHWKQTSTPSKRSGESYSGESLGSVYARKGSIAELTRAFAAFVERPEKVVTDSASRMALARKIFGDTRLQNAVQNGHIESPIQGNMPLWWWLPIGAGALGLLFLVLSSTRKSRMLLT